MNPWRKIMTCVMIMSVCWIEKTPERALASVPCSADGYACIMNASDLNNIRNYLNNTSVKFRLGADINLSGYDAGDGYGWMPIGDSSTPFKGQLDGNGYAIKNLTINRSSMLKVGMFGEVENGKIENLKMENANVTGDQFVGVAAGSASNFQFENVQTSGSVNGAEAGGIAGDLYHGNILKSSSSATVTSSFMGGGLVGYSSESTIKWSFSTGNIGMLENGFYIGGLVGTASESTIQESFARGKTVGAYYVAGLIGGVENSNNVQNAYASGDVEGSNYVGGLIGASEYDVSTVTNSFSVGKVTGKNNVGGAIGTRQAGDTITNVYYDSTKSLQSDTGKGVGRTTAQMKLESTYGGFNFTSIWSLSLDQNDGYPHLLMGESALPTNTLSVLHMGIAAGNLSVTTPTISTPFSAVTLNGSAQKVTAGISPLTFSDARGAGNGYYVTVSASPFTKYSYLEYYSRTVKN